MMDYEIICGDAVAEMSKLRERGVTADLVFTSPPYNLGNTTGAGVKQYSGYYSPKAGFGKRGGGLKRKWQGAALADGYGQHDDNMPHDEYVAWQNNVLRACWQMLSDDGAIYYNHKPRILNGCLVTPLDYVPSELRQYVRQEVIWARAGGINSTLTFYLPTHERIVVIAKPDFRLRSKAASGVGDVWYVPQERDNPHPAPFPVELPARAVETTNAKLVLDPFCGSGTTGEAGKTDEAKQYEGFARKKVEAQTGTPPNGKMSKEAAAAVLAACAQGGWTQASLMTASADEVKRCYRQAADKEHPDHGGSDLTFARINEAYRVMTSPS